MRDLLSETFNSSKIKNGEERHKMREKEKKKKEQSVIYNIIIYTAAWTASRAQDQS